MNETEKKVLEYIDGHRELLYNDLLDLLAIKSENFITYGGEKPCAEFVKKKWDSLGLDSRLYSPLEIEGVKEHPAYIDGRGTGERPNVTAKLAGRDASKKIMILAHTDTMPIGDEEGWTVKPLGEIKDGRIYGRGSNDNKFGVAEMTFITRMFTALNLKPACDTLFTAYSDEEFGGGGGTLSACIGYPCDAYINLDGGNCELWPVALGGQAIQMTVNSDDILDSSENIVDALCIIKSVMAPFGERRRKELDRNPHYKGTDMQRSAFRVTGFKAGEMGCDLSTGRIQMSYYTDAPKEQIEKELGEAENEIKSRIAPLSIKTDGFTPMSRFFDYGVNEDTLGIIPAFKRASMCALGREPAVAGSCLTDLNLMLKFGSKNSVNFGLVRDFKLYGGAHQPDEFVECDRLTEHVKILALFLLNN